MVSANNCGKEIEDACKSECKPSSPEDKIVDKRNSKIANFDELDVNDITIIEEYASTDHDSTIHPDSTTHRHASTTNMAIPRPSSGSTAGYQTDIPDEDESKDNENTAREEDNTQEISNEVANSATKSATKNSSATGSTASSADDDAKSSSKKHLLRAPNAANNKFLSPLDTTADAAQTDSDSKLILENAGFCKTIKNKALKSPHAGAGLSMDGNVVKKRASINSDGLKSADSDGEEKKKRLNKWQRLRSGWTTSSLDEKGNYKHWINTTQADFFFGGFILLNGIVLAIETDARQGENEHNVECVLSLIIDNGLII